MSEFKVDSDQNDGIEELCQMEISELQGSSFESLVVGGAVHYGEFRYSGGTIEFSVQLQKCEIRVQLENCKVIKRGFNHVKNNELSRGTAETSVSEAKIDKEGSLSVGSSEAGSSFGASGSISGSQKSKTVKSESIKSNEKKYRVSYSAGNRWIAEAIGEKFLNGCYFSDHELFTLVPIDKNIGFAFSVECDSYKDKIEITAIGNRGKSLSKILSSNKDKCFKMLAEKGLRGSQGDKIVLSSLNSRVIKC